MLSTEEAVASCEQLPPVKISIEILQQCRKRKDLSYARHVHAQLCNCGLEAHVVLGNHLVPTFVECGSIIDAQRTFNQLILRNEFCWTSLVQGYIDDGQLDQALQLYKIMQNHSVSPSRFTYMALLKVCSQSKCIEVGQKLHADISEKGLEIDLFLGNTLIDMYAKCGCFMKAEEVVAQLSSPDVVSWTALISGYAEHDLTVEALNSFEQMEASDVLPDVITYNCILKALGISRDIEWGQKLHSKIILSGLDDDLSICSSLVDMYMRCGSLEESYNIFCISPNRDVTLWNALISGYTESGYDEQALSCFEQMQLEQVSPDSVTYIYCLRACGASENIEKGRELQSMIPRQELMSDPYVGNALLDMYVKCSSLREARDVLDKLPLRNVVSWNTLISGYVEYGLGEEALECLQEMHSDQVCPNAVTVVCALKACGALGDMRKGFQLHNAVFLLAFERNLPVVNSLVDMYARCGFLTEAEAIFNKMVVRDEVSWTTLIAGYTEQGLGENALHHLKQMQFQGFVLDAITLVCSLKACINVGAIKKGRAVHTEIVKKGFEVNVFIGNSLVDIYSKHGLLIEAAAMLDTLPARDVFSWNSLIAGYVEYGLGEEALNCLLEMQVEGMPPDSVTLLCALKACGAVRSLQKGQDIHTEILKRGFETDKCNNMLVDMYAKCGYLLDAECLLFGIQTRDSVAWTALIAGYVEQGLGNKALYCYQLMVSEGVPSDEVALICGLKACGDLSSLYDGQILHIEIVKCGFEEYVQVGNSLIDMYIKCSLLAEAQAVFDKFRHRDAISWTSLISGYSDNGIVELSLRYLELMSSEGISSDVITLTSCLEACANVGAISIGTELHMEVIKKGVETDQYLGNTVVAMYGKCGFYDEANVVFDKLSIQDCVSWNALIAGYADNGRFQEAVECLTAMQNLGIAPDEASWNILIWAFAKQEETDQAFETFGRLLEQGLLPNIIIMDSLLKACGGPLACEIAKRIHAQSQAFSIGEFESNLSTALLDIYSKYGSIVDAQHMFDAMPKKTVTAWNTLIAGFARVGENETVFSLFQRMDDEGIQPNEVTFLILLTVCCHAGLLERGRYFFTAMSREYGVYPSIKHYTCMIDLLGRLGLLCEAITMMKKMPFIPDSAVWSTILTACQKWGNVDLGKEAFSQVIELDEEHAGSFIMMSNLGHRDILEREKEI